MPRRVLVATLIALISAAFAACGDGTGEVSATTPSPAAPILLFTGTGTSSNDVAAVEAVLDSSHLVYASADSAQLNAMDEVHLRDYRLLIVPGGNFIDIGKSLTPATAANIRNAVRNGLNYFGICAGGFLAGHFTGYNSFDLTGGVKFGFYAAEAKGIRKTAVDIALADGATLDQYWEDGPQFSGWGAVVGKYPDATPAVVEQAYGRGWVILAGIHAEAPERWRRGMHFTTPATIDNAYAGALIRAALDGTPLPHY